jgi:hypothetical protein
MLAVANLNRSNLKPAKRELVRPFAGSFCA